MQVRWSLLALVAACYQPTVHEGAPCGPEAACPVGQECRAGTCFFTSTPPDASHDSQDMDTSMITVDAAPDGPRYIAWGTPVKVTSLSQPGADDPSVTTDRLTVVIAATSTAAPSNDDLFIGTRATLSDPFTVTALTALNSTSSENSPEISGDGKTIYFTSDRSGTENVYMSTQSGGVWSAPTLVTELSTGTNGDLAISPDGKTAAVMHNATIYIHTRASTTTAWGTGVSHHELDGANDAAPSITNGAQTIYFHAGSSRDIYVSHRVGTGLFDPPTPVTELNTSGRDAAPFVNEADDYMIFERDNDIYEATR